MKLYIRFAAQGLNGIYCHWHSCDLNGMDMVYYHQANLV